MIYIITVLLLLVAGILVLRGQRLGRPAVFEIMVFSAILFVIGCAVGLGIGRILGVDEYLVRRGLTETPVEEAIYLVPGSLFGVVCFWWMLRKHLSIRSSQPRPADAARGG